MREKTAKPDGCMEEKRITRFWKFVTAMVETDQLLFPQLKNLPLGFLFQIRPTALGLLYDHGSPSCDKIKISTMFSSKLYF